jgi:hypothetical protein
LSPSFAACVDVLGGAQALSEREAGLVEQRDEDAVDQEARRVLRRHDRLVELRHHGHRRVVGGVADVCSASDHLDELHHRHRVEEVHAHHRDRGASWRRRAGDGDAAGVAREDRAGLQGGVELAKSRSLVSTCSVDGLDHEVAVAEVTSARERGDSSYRCVTNVGRELPFFDEARERARDRVAAFRRQLERRVRQ